MSVVIPTLNTRGDYLKETLEAINSQSYLPFEVVIVNNGEGEVYTDEYSFPIRHYKIMNRAGVAQARNFGASLAASDYIAFIDDDDLWATDYLEIMASRIQKYRPACLIARLDELKNNKILPFKNSLNYLNQDSILVRNPGITGSSVVVEKDSFFKIGGYNPKLPPSEDKALVLDFILNDLPVMSVPECQAILRQHPIQNRLTSNKSMAEGIFQFYRQYKSEMNAYQRYNNLYKIYLHRWLCYNYLKDWLVLTYYRFILIIFKFSSIKTNLKYK